MLPQEIANRVARRHCDAIHDGILHLGAIPCARCAEIRGMVMEAFEEFLSELLLDATRNR